MRVAVCCPGPSLPKRWPGDYGYAGVWSVNRALLVVPETDWLSAGDRVVYDKLLGNARPRLGAIAMPDAVDDIPPAWAGTPFISWTSLKLWPEHKVIKHVNWSVQTALMHACELGATRIDLYGCDGAASGTEVDCTGHVNDSRNAERWRREEEDLAATFGLLLSKGTTVNRISP